MSRTEAEPSSGETDLAARAEAIIEFWFSDAARERWFAKDAAFDRTITETFIADYERIARGELNGWPSTPRGLLALVILLDQYSRNMFRDDALAFSADAAARSLADAAIERGFDAELSAEMRRFLYMPFMHSEDSADQERCVDLFKQFGDDDKSLDFARRHKDIIDRFGRFPHRNAVLGRESTPEELDFLKDPDSSF